MEQHPERTPVVVLGDSIAYGSGLASASDAFPAQLEARLQRDASAPGYCVMSFAQPGFHFDQSFTVARRELARHPRSIVVWQLWNDRGAYRVLGDAAYAVDGSALRPDGFIGIAGVPDAANRWLFSTSRLYQLTAVAFGERDEGGAGPA